MTDACRILYSFCTSLQLDVLYMQAQRLSRSLWGPHIRFSHNQQADALTLAYWPKSTLLACLRGLGGRSTGNVAAVVNRDAKRAFALSSAAGVSAGASASASPAPGGGGQGSVGAPGGAAPPLASTATSVRAPEDSAGFDGLIRRPATLTIVVPSTKDKSSSIVHHKLTVVHEPTLQDSDTGEPLTLSVEVSACTVSPCIPRLWLE